MGRQTRAKEFLQQAFHINRRISNGIEQVASLRELAGKASAALTNTKVTGTKNVHRMEDAIAELMELEDEINEDVISLVALKREIVSVINRVEKPSCQTLLSLRYLCFKTWEQIAEDMSYSVQHTHRIHGAALEAVESILRHNRAR
jgi:DNA-directed RNA polymerase specialized sigma subunit